MFEARISDWIHGQPSPTPAKHAPPREELAALAGDRLTSASPTASQSSPALPCGSGSGSKRANTSWEQEAPPDAKRIGRSSSASVEPPVATPPMVAANGSGGRRSSTRMDTVGDEQPEHADAATERQLKKLCKAARAIERLQQQARDGKELSSEEQTKVARLAELEAQLALLQSPPPPATPTDLTRALFGPPLSAEAELSASRTMPAAAVVANDMSTSH